MQISLRHARIVHATSKQVNRWGFGHVIHAIVHGVRCLCATDGKQVVCIPTTESTNDALGIVDARAFELALSELERREVEINEFDRDDDDPPAPSRWMEMTITESGATIDGITFPRPDCVCIDVAAVVPTAREGEIAFRLSAELLRKVFDAMEPISSVELRVMPNASGQPIAIWADVWNQGVPLSFGVIMPITDRTEKKP